jgi:hypothetical protein
METAMLIDSFIVLAMRGLDIAGKLNRGEEITNADLALPEDFTAALARMKKEREQNTGSAPPGGG